MRTFVSGGTGFIGHHLVDQLLEKGHEVVYLTHKRKSNNKMVETVQGDIADMESLRAMEDYDFVFANAALATTGLFKGKKNGE